jgi:hypothetical protein
VVAQLFTRSEAGQLIAEDAVDVKTIAGLALAGFQVATGSPDRTSTPA